MEPNFHYELLTHHLVRVQCAICSTEYTFDYTDIRDVNRIDEQIQKACPSCAAIRATAWYNLLISRAQAIPAYLRPYAYRFG